MGLEIIDQVPDVDAVIVPVGGAGLIAGVSLAVKTLRPEVTVVVGNHDAACEPPSAVEGSTVGRG